MSEKRETSEGAYDVVLQGSRDMVKAILPELQSPAVEPHTHRHSVYGRCCHERTVSLSRTVLSAWQAIGSEPIQGDEWGTYVALDTFNARRNAGSPTGREPYGDGVPIVV